MVLELIPEVADSWGQRLTPPQAELAAGPCTWGVGFTGQHRPPRAAAPGSGPQTTGKPPASLPAATRNLWQFEAGREMCESQGARSSAESGSQLLSFKANLNQWAAFNYLVV